MDRRMIFSRPMVRALLAGAKTQTRRRVTWRPGAFARGYTEPVDCPSAPTWEPRGSGGVGHKHPDGAFCYCPVVRMPALPGDTIRVLETWRVDDFDDTQTIYAADVPDEVIRETKGVIKSRSPIHLPDERVRLFLHVTDVRVERLHAITEADARAEGVDAVSVADVPRNGTLCRRDDFAQIWEVIHGAGTWRSNPWVYRIAFTCERRDAR